MAASLCRAAVCVLLLLLCSSLLVSVATALPHGAQAAARPSGGRPASKPSGGHARTAQALAEEKHLREAAEAYNATDPSRPFAVFGYLPDYRHNTYGADTCGRHTYFFPYEEFFARGLTHLIFFSVEIDPTSLELTGVTERLPKSKEWSLVRGLADTYNVKLMVCIGGGGRSSGFGPLVRNAAKRRALVEQLNALYLERRLDGVDVNWEYPQTMEEWQLLGTLLREMRAVLGFETVTVTGADGVQRRRRRRLRSRVPTLTIALHPHPQAGALLRQNDVLDAVDYVHWMAYDFRLAPNEQPDDEAPVGHTAYRYVSAMLEDEVLDGFNGDRPAGKGGSKLAVYRDPRRKLTVGIPLYGQHIAEFYRDPMTYKELIETQLEKAAAAHPGVTGTALEEAAAAAIRPVNDVNRYTFSGYDEIQKKMELVRRRGPPGGLGGIMIWELGQDLLPPSAHPLAGMNAIAEVLQKRWGNVSRPWAGRVGEGVKQNEANTDAAPPTSAAADAKQTTTAPQQAEQDYEEISDL